MQTNTRKFQNDIKQSINMTGASLEKPLQKVPEATQNTRNNPPEPKNHKNPSFEKGSLTPRMFLNDLKQTAGVKSEPFNVISEPLPKPQLQPLQKGPEAIRFAGSNPFESQEYIDLALQKANENARLIKEQADREIHEILTHIQRIKVEYAIEASQIDDRIEKKQKIVTRLRNLMASLEDAPACSDPALFRTEELYRSINHQAKKLSILTAVFDDLGSIKDSF